MSGTTETKLSWHLFSNNKSNSKNNNSGDKSSSIGKFCLNSCKTKTTTTLTMENSKKTKCHETTAELATSRSSSSSAIITSVRPQTLNVHNSRQKSIAEATFFIGEALNAWRAKARWHVVPAERVQELFQELQFNPSEKQINEMLQTAKVFTRKSTKNVNGLTFGEFCVLAADLKRFRTCNSTTTDLENTLSSLPVIRSIEDCSSDLSATSIEESSSSAYSTNSSFVSDNKSSKTSLNASSAGHSVFPSSDKSSPEVFLGGSCNPTTWRADVAMPALKELGISFYNPQVSDWTPDLIELEHRAKEKARVLFFVMDSETRASAGAIEAAHIAGQNSKQLVLVLHPYKPDQCILKERISKQEYIDLSRNQQILRELVMRRGLSVLDNIPSALQRTKQILAGIRDPPTNIASVLIVVRGAFDRVVNSVEDDIPIQQCQRALSILGYAQSLLTLENLRKIILSQKESFGSLNKSTNNGDTQSSSSPGRCDVRINFDEFCILAAYLSVLQHEIHESGCISPIKGTNLPPPPIYLANMQEGYHRAITGENNISITSSCTSVPDDRNINDMYRNRDSGTSSPQPNELPKSKYLHIGKRSKICLNVALSTFTNTEVNTEEESDSNDSVFSSGSSINSINCCELPFSSLEFRDVYLGGSCYLRTKWRQDYCIPYLKTKGVTFHLPALHESILPSQLNVSEQITVDESEKSTSYHQRTRRKERTLSNTQNSQSTECQSPEEESSNWHLAIRPNLCNSSLLDSSRVLLFVITNETRSLAPMTLAAHCIGLMYNVVLCVQMLPEFCIIGNEKLTPTAIKDYNRGRSYLIDLAKRQGVPVFNDLKASLECTVEKVKACNSRNSV